MQNYQILISKKDIIVKTIEYIVLDFIFFSSSSRFFFFKLKNLYNIIIEQMIEIVKFICVNMKNNMQ